MVAIYCRISGKKADGRDVSIEDQEAQGIAFANQMGLTYRIYKDVGISGAKNEVEERPMFAEMFEDLEKGEISAVFAIDQSRIERNSRVWQLFVYAVTTNDCKYYEGGNLVDLEDPQTKFITGVISLANELYAAITGQKVKSANRRNALKGKGHGITAYGYRKNQDGYLVIDDEQAEWVKQIFQWSLDGIGTYTIAKKLNDFEVPTKSSQYGTRTIERKDKYTGRKTKYSRSEVKWRGNVVHDMITNPVYKGERRYADVVTQINGIIPKDLWDQVNKNLTENKKKVGPKNKFKYLLNGITFCADCGAELRGKYRLSGRHKTYSCKGTSQGLTCENSRGINIVALESFVIHHLFHSKDLYNKLSGLKVDETAVDIYQKKLSNLNKKEQELIQSKDHLYKLLKNPALAKDDAIMNDYIKAKNDIDLLLIEKKQIQDIISSLSLNQRKARLDKVFREFDYKMNFDQIKESIHSIVEFLKVKHSPDERLFFVQVQYKGFDETSVFVSDHQLNKWVNMSHYKTVPKTEEDKQRDNDLFDYLAHKTPWSRKQMVDALKELGYWDDNYGELSDSQLLEKVKQIPDEEEEESVISITTDNVELLKKELYDFNSLPS